ncbi:MAG TPA: hypothetical protein VKA76_15590 [Gammaproteobacteria bacterium]|nr:hypothetical protein [Gammaproteobacteria bacterium]HYW91228.1 hypothetical protein [Gammaproteobacteria bacterium]
MGHVALTALIWEASVVLLTIGFVEMGIGKNDPKDFAFVLLTGAILESISLAILIAAKDMFGAIAAAAFIFLLWDLGAGVFAKTNRVVQAHGVWFTGVYFLCAGIYLAMHGVIITSIAFLLLVPVTWLLAIGTYTGKAAFGKLGGFFSAVDAVVFFIIAFAGAIGRPLP